MFPLMFEIFPIIYPESDTRVREQTMAHILVVVSKIGKRKPATGTENTEIYLLLRIQKSKSTPLRR